MKYWLVLLITSCSSYFPPIRGEYVLSQTEHFVISNMYVNPSNLSTTKDHLIIQYDIIIKNISKKNQPINLSEANIQIADKKQPLDCGTYVNSQKQFPLDAGAQTRIICVGKIDKKMGLARSDYKAVLEIPLVTDKAKFTYLIRAEDF
jgi:hypothetical protein